MAYFVDTWYWAALFYPRDQHHPTALALKAKVGSEPLVTSQFVLIEFLGMCAKCGEEVRRACIKFVTGLNTIPHITVVPYSDKLYAEAIALYEQVSNDKGWSLVDCASIIIMENRNIKVALSGDKHFEERPGMSLLTLDGYQELLQMQQLPVISVAWQLVPRQTGAQRSDEIWSGTKELGLKFEHLKKELQRCRSREHVG